MWLTTSTIMSFTTEPRQIQNSNYGIGTKFRSDKRISKKMIDRYLYMIIIYVILLQKLSLSSEQRNDTILSEYSMFMSDQMVCYF